MFCNIHKRHEDLKRFERNLPFCGKTSTPIPVWFRDGGVRGQAFLFSTHPTPRTTQTGRRRALTVCKGCADNISLSEITNIVLVFRWSHLVVTGDGNVHVSQWGVSVAQGNGGDVDVGSLGQWLMVSTGVGHNQKARLPESCLDLIGECTRGESTVEGGGTGGRGKLQHCSLKWKNKLHSRSQILMMLFN